MESTSNSVSRLQTRGYVARGARCGESRGPSGPAIRKKCSAVGFRMPLLFVLFYNEVSHVSSFFHLGPKRKLVSGILGYYSTTKINRAG